MSDFTDSNTRDDSFQSGNDTSSYGQTQSVGQDGNYSADNSASYQSQGKRFDDDSASSRQPPRRSNDDDDTSGSGNQARFDSQGDGDNNTDSFAGGQGQDQDQAGSGGVGGGEVDKDGYPPQLHAGKVGLGPHYHEGPTLADKMQGVKETIKGKITRDPELAEQGKQRITGELQEKERAEDQAEDPFAAEKKAASKNEEGDSYDSSTKDDAATAGTQSGQGNNDDY
ncbi:hypothetical protein T439DRAFT_327417 [Meredithblackwellia eburnea MCA 4105]